MALYGLKRAAYPATVIAAIGIASLPASCGTADTNGDGRCKPVSGGGDYVAAAKDIDGDNWTIEIDPDSVEVGCPANAAQTAGSGTLRFATTIRNGKGIGVAGVQLGWFTNLPSSFVNMDGSSYDLSTDSCGVGYMDLLFTCPPGYSNNVKGWVSVNSGPLAIKSTIEVRFAGGTSLNVTTNKSGKKTDQ